jgi:serine protease AprX
VDGGEATVTKPQRGGGKGQGPLKRDPFGLDKAVVSVPLLEKLKDDQKKKGAGAGAPVRVIIDLNLMYPGGREAARRRVFKLVAEVTAGKTGQAVNKALTRTSTQYVYARLDGDSITTLVKEDGKGESHAIYRIWPDFAVKALINKSISTVKADAAARSFSALGSGICWAVIDSGIDRDHEHFTARENLELPRGLRHQDFTDGATRTSALTDPFGHGTHVAGIIAGGMTPGEDDEPIRAFHRRRVEGDEVKTEREKVTTISGMAPDCKLLSLRVLGENGEGLASSCIAALEYVQELNGNGRLLRVHGVNLSVGYEFDPEWFACGQSPLCVQVDQLVRSGVVVVVAAGNSGYGFAEISEERTVTAGLDLTINDPGNADRAITVGATHRDMPHVYGVSYFSSKGPTGDGRLKPDVVAPGEKILSCAAGLHVENGEGPPTPRDYVEQSGTSMAAPHVSGVIAAFLSVRREFIGQPETVKEIFTSTATNLHRRETFQGKGLVDLMRAIQSV